MSPIVFGDRYVTTGKTMTGGGNEVYVCRDPNLERYVVVKFLLDQVDRNRLQDEIVALQRIRSKNVIQILDLVDDPYRGVGIVAEYLPGSDLSDQNELPTDRTALLRMIYQIANGLCDIHAAGLIHRDIKPQNIKYGDERILKIFDFNLSRDEANAETLGFRGSQGFAAPEQYAAGVVTFTPKTDVYSLAAVVAYLGGQGRLPRGLVNRPPDPSAWVEGFGGLPLLDAELAVILQQALAIDPAARPTSEHIRNVARDLIRRGSHRAIITVRGDSNAYLLDATNSNATIRHTTPGGGTIKIVYDGLRFVAKELQGPVFINRIACVTGQSLPDSCVIDIAGPGSRMFVTFDLAHPEVVQ